MGQEPIPRQAQGGSEQRCNSGNPGQRRRPSAQPGQHLSSEGFDKALLLGPDLVDAAALPRLYDGAVRPRHLVGALVAGVLALAAAVSVTPVGQQWVDELSPSVSSTTSDLIDNVRGILP